MDRVTRTNEVTYLIVDEYSQALKFGKTMDPHSRIHAIQVGNPNEIKVVRWIWGTHERRLKAVARHHHIRGEWYSLDAFEGVYREMDAIAEEAMWHPSPHLLSVSRKAAAKHGLTEQTRVYA